ncbi:MAG: hypothetical protein R3A47_08820 [Polyangiales bacterium]
MRNSVPPTHLGSPLVVFAGAGAAKPVITHRIAYLVGEKGGLVAHHGGDVHEQGCRRNEAERSFAGSEAEGLVVGTFHATCARFLRRYADEIGVDLHSHDLRRFRSAGIVKRIIRDEASTRSGIL